MSDNKSVSQTYPKPPEALLDYEECGELVRGAWACGRVKGHLGHHVAAINCSCGWWNWELGMYDPHAQEACRVHKGLDSPLTLEASRE